MGAVLAASLAAGPAPAAETPVTRTFTPTGGERALTVPGGVTRMTVRVVGAPEATRSSPSGAWGRWSRATSP